MKRPNEPKYGIAPVNAFPKRTVTMNVGKTKYATLKHRDRSATNPSDENTIP
jgi:hypothetical protein